MAPKDKLESPNLSHLVNIASPAFELERVEEGTPYSYSIVGPNYTVRHMHYLVNTKSHLLHPLPVVDSRANNFEDLLNMFRRDYLESIYIHFLVCERRTL